MKPHYCWHCDTYHEPAQPCAVPVDPFKEKEQTASERPEYFRGAKISKPASRKQQS